MNFQQNCLKHAGSFVVAALFSFQLHAGVVLPSDVLEKRLGTEILWQAFLRLPKENRPKIILVLGGGGAKGLSHIGVLRVFEQERIPVDEIVGVSVGALIGSLYSSGVSLDEIERMAEKIGWNQLTNFSRVRVLKLLFSKFLFSTEKMETYLNRYIGNKNIQDFPIPFSCVATDLRTGDRVVFNEGPAALAARASATIPGIFEPVQFRQRILVDGGVVDNLPTDLAHLKSTDVFVVAVLPQAGVLVSDYSTTFGAMARSLEIQKNNITEVQKRANFLIEPDVHNVSMADLSKSRECVDAGLIETRRVALDIKRSILARVLAQ